MRAILQKLKKRTWLLLLSLLAFLLPFLTVKAQRPYVIVIDPGHGGENLGAQYDGYTEKEMTMIVARAMKEELEKYENVAVYLTHDTDTDMSLEERAEFALQKQADFLFCLHFNSSVKHNLYGAEVWIPAFDDYYVSGRQFAEIEMEVLTGSGLYSRGIKTKLSKRGDDYYGILRHCSERQIPSVLIEHCHLDHDYDKPFYQKGEEQLREFGRKDAEAAARYFGLVSAVLGTDYSQETLREIKRPEGAVKPDETQPETCDIRVLSIDEKTGEITVNMTASDSDSYIQYYQYSFDGGSTVSELKKWPRPVWYQSDPELTFKVTVPFDEEIRLCAYAYNGFDLKTMSNIVPVAKIPSFREEEITKEKPNKHYREISYEGAGETDTQKSILLIVVIVLLSLLISCFIYIVSGMLLRRKRKKRKRNSRRRGK